MTENKQRAVGGRGDGGAALCLQAHLQLPVSAHVRSGLQFHPLITAAASDHKILIQQVKMISIQIGSGVIIGLNLLQDILLRSLGKRNGLMELLVEGIVSDRQDTELGQTVQIGLQILRFQIQQTLRLRVIFSDRTGTAVVVIE